MGIAVAEMLAADGAPVAVMARGRGPLTTRRRALHAAGSPEAVGISVDMTDPPRSPRGSASGGRWGSLNSCPHDRPRRRSVRGLDDSGWDPAFALGTMSAVRACVPPLPLLRPRRGSGSPCSPPTRSSGRARSLWPIPRRRRPSPASPDLAKSLAPDGILVNAVCPAPSSPRTQLREPEDMFAAEGLDPSDPRRYVLIDQTFHQPADLGRAGAARRGGLPHRHLVFGATATSPVPASTPTAAPTS